MKRTWSKLLACMLCMVLLVSLLAACGTKEKNDAPANNSNSMTKEEDKGNDGQNEDQKQDDKQEETGNEADPGTEGDKLTELTLPLSEEKAEVSVWTLWNNQYVENPNDLDSVKKMEELTNVHINWSLVTIQEASEKFGLMLASGAIPDIVYCFGMVSYPGGNDKAVEDGIFLDATDLVENYMPNYRSLREQSADLLKDTMTDSGRLVAIYGMNTADAGVAREMEWAGLSVRQDLLDQWNVPTPVTIEDWHTVLATAKKNGMTEPLLVGMNGYMNTGAFMTAYGILPEFYQENGVVKYGPAEPGYKEWVQLMRDWYAEGLLDPNFTTTNAALSGDVIYTTTDRSVGFPVLYGFTANGYHLSGQTENADINVAGVANPVLNAGDTSYAVQITSPTCGNETFISASSKDPVLAAKWLDYQFSQEGMLLNYYGIEGDTYTKGSDGSIQYTEKITADANLSPSDAKTLYIRGNGCGLYNWESVAHTTMNYEACSVAQKTWSGMDMSLNLPKQMSMTEEEGTEYSSLYTAVQTLVNEMTVKYIMGTESMDSYDNFLAQLESYNLGRCIEIKQAALDRYNNRGK